MTNGFQTEQHPDSRLALAEGYEKDQLGEMTEEEKSQWRIKAFKDFFESYFKVKYRGARGDIDSSTAICVTLKPEIAPLFPIESLCAGWGCF